WANRQAVGDMGNQFHYYRLTADDRILWGGYDAIYHFGRRIRAEYDQRPSTFVTLAQHFYETFPQLGDVRFTHRWGGVIDTSTNSGGAATAIARSSSWCGPSRCRPRPSPSPTPGSRPRAGRWPAPTATPTVATCGCRRWTGSASASTPSRACWNGRGARTRGS